MGTRARDRRHAEEPDRRSRPRPDGVGVRRTVGGNGEDAIGRYAFCPSCGESHEIQSASTDHLHGSRVASIMTRYVLCVRADLGVDSLATLLLERGFRGAAVVDESGRATGWISMEDILWQREIERDTQDETPSVDAIEPGFHVETGSDTTVGDLMSPRVPAILESMSIPAAAAILASEEADEVPVIARDRRVVGRLRAVDVLAWYARQGEGLVHPTLYPAGGNGRPS